jgi:tRNA 2-thiouridine synthesizing protein A
VPIKNCRENVVTAPDHSHIPDLLLGLMTADAGDQLVAAEVDARGLMCPMPLLKAKQALRPLAAGDLLRVWATDSGSLKDFVAFAQLTGQLLEGFDLRDGAYCYLIRKQSS